MAHQAVAGAEAGGGEESGADDLAGLANRLIEHKGRGRATWRWRSTACSRCRGCGGCGCARGPQAIRLARPDQHVLDLRAFCVATLGEIDRTARKLSPPRPPSASNSGTFGVVSVASAISRLNAAIVSASNSTAPLVETMTGSKITGSASPSRAVGHGVR